MKKNQFQNTLRKLLQNKIKEKEKTEMYNINIQ